MKYYAQKRGCGTIRKIIADSDEDAFNKAAELFGTDDVIICSLKKAVTREEQKKIYKESEELAGKLFGEQLKTTMKFLHQS